MTKENLEIIKTMAIQLLYLEVKEDTRLSHLTSITQKYLLIHPVFEESPMIYMDESGQFCVLDILHDEKALETAREIKKEHFSTCEDLNGIFWLIRKPWRLDFLQRIKKYLDNKEFSELLGDIWVDVESPNMDGFVSTDVLLNWFQIADKTSLMSEEELEIYHHLPDTFQIYRGVGTKSNLKGFSWTTNLEVAEQFANRYSMLDGNGYVVVATVKREDVLAYFSRRKEDEYIVDGRKLDIQELK